MSFSSDGLQLCKGDILVESSNEHNSSYVGAKHVYLRLIIYRSYGAYRFIR